MKEQLKKLALYLSNKGIPIPLIRDNKIGRGSISLTMLVTSGVLVVISILINMGAYVCHTYFNCAKPEYFPMSETLMWFGTCAGLYWGRATGKDENVQKDS